MAFKRAVFTLTAGANGDAKATVHLPIPLTPARIGFIDHISFDDSASTSTPAAFVLFESDDDDREALQLFSMSGRDLPRAQMTYDTDGVPTPRAGLVFPRTATGLVDENGAALTSPGVKIPIRSSYLRAWATGLTTGDVYTVVVAFETAGDMRY